MIRTVHHLQNVAPHADKPLPMMISRMVDTLAEMIKPASPSQHTRDLISGNARNWGHTTCLILTEHYEASLEDFLGDLVGGPTTDWKEAFQVASRWARRNLPRITRAVLDHAEAVITARLTGEQQPQALAPQSGAVPAQTTATTDAQTETRPPQQKPPATTVSVATATVSVATETSRAHDWTSVPLDGEPPQEQRDMSRRGGTAVRSTSMGDSLPPGQGDGLPQGQHDGPPRDQGPLIDLNDLDPPSKKKVDADPRSEVSLGLEDLEDDDILRVPVRTASQLEIERIFDELQAEEEREEAEALAAQLAAQEPEVPGEVPDEDEDEFEQSFDYSRPPVKFSVRRHKSTANKMVDWHLDVTRKHLILGDSNLSRFPDFPHPDLQIESYPGANFRHAESFIRKATVPPGLTVTNVILSFGLNSRGNKPKETTIRNLQAALRAVKSRFPYARCWVAQVNFSRKLPPVEQSNLTILNEHMRRNMQFVPLLPYELFSTEADNVHWTARTAKAMLEYWVEGLNSWSP